MKVVKAAASSVVTVLAPRVRKEQAVLTATAPGATARNARSVKATAVAAITAHRVPAETSAATTARVPVANSVPVRVETIVVPHARTEAARHSVRTATDRPRAVNSMVA